VGQWIIVLSRGSSDEEFALSSSDYRMSTSANADELLLWKASNNCSAFFEEIHQYDVVHTKIPGKLRDGIAANIADWGTEG